MYVALNSISHELVAIKKVKMVSEKEQIESESKLLKSCKSRYVVGYYDVVRKENELWVRVD